MSGSTHNPIDEVPVRNVRLFGTLADGTDVQLADQFGGGLLVITTEHERVHAGESFSVTQKVSLANGAQREYILNVPADESHTHLRDIILATTAGPIEIVITEDVTTSADGTVISPINHNRNSTKTSSTVVTHSPTGVTGGLEIYTSATAGTKHESDASGTGAAEFIIKLGAKTHLKFLNSSGGAATIWIGFLFYDGSAH